MGWNHQPFLLTAKGANRLHHIDSHGQKQTQKSADRETQYSKEQREVSGRANKFSGLFQFRDGDISVPQSAAAAVKHAEQIKAELG